MDQIHTHLVEAIKTYRMPQTAVELLSQNPPIIFASVTAGGKDSVAEQIQQTSDFRRIVTTTTRPMRPGEQNGREYWFVDQEEMLRLVQQQAFIEVKLIHEQQISGPSLAAYQSILDDGHKPLLAVDVQGVSEILEQVANIRPFFILPPSFEVWMDRLGSRGPMSHVEKIRRLKSAYMEIEEVLANEHFILVVNQDIHLVAQEILKGATDLPTQKHNKELAQQLLEHIRAYK